MRQRKINEDVMRAELVENCMRGKTANAVADDFQHRAEYFR